MVVGTGSVALTLWVLGGAFGLIGLVLGGFVLRWLREQRVAERSWPRAQAELVAWVFVSIGDTDGYFPDYAFTAPDGQPVRGQPVHARGLNEPGPTGAVTTVLVDPRDPERFLLTGPGQQRLVTFIAATLIGAGALLLALAAAGVGA